MRVGFSIWRSIFGSLGVGFVCVRVVVIFVYLFSFRLGFFRFILLGGGENRRLSCYFFYLEVSLCGRWKLKISSCG